MVLAPGGHNIGSDGAVPVPQTAMGSTQDTLVSRWALVGCAGLALAVIVIATVKGLLAGWQAIGDNGLMYVRTRDVFSSHVPLLGNWSSGSVKASAIFNHPGPLLFYLLAVPTRIFGPSGLAVGTALLNALAVVGIGLVTARRAGALVGAVSVAIAATLCWSMGNRLLFDPWTPSSLLLPSLLFLFLVWATSSGDLVMLPWVVGVGSLLLETNLEYALVVPLLGVWAVVGLAFELRGRRREQPDGWPALRRRAARTTAVSVLVLSACWIPPLIEEVVNGKQGNLSRMLSSAHGLRPGLGVHDALRLFGGITAVPPWWLRWSMRDLCRSLPRVDVTITLLCVVAVVLTMCAWDGWRRRDRVVTAAVVTVAVASVVAVITLVEAPVEVPGRPSFYQVRFAWPIGAFLLLTVLLTPLRRVRGATTSAVVGAATLLATIVVGAFTVPDASAGSHAPDGAQAVARDLNRQLGALEHRGTLLVDFHDDSSSYQFYAAGVIAELARRHVRVVVEQPFLVRELGDHRKFNGANADAVVLLSTGDDHVQTTPPGARRVAAHEGLTTAERRELSALRGEIGQYIRAGHLQLTDDGVRALQRLAQAQRSPRAPTGFDPGTLFATRGLTNLFEHDFLVLDPVWFQRFARYATLQRTSDIKTVAVFVAPPTRVPAYTGG